MNEIYIRKTHAAMPTSHDVFINNLFAGRVDTGTPGGSRLLSVLSQHAALVEVADAAVQLLSLGRFSVTSATEFLRDDLEKKWRAWRSTLDGGKEVKQDVPNL